MAVQKTNDRQIFGDLIRSYRKTRGMAQCELAKRAHVPVPHLSQVESGQRPCGPALTSKLARALEITDKAELLRFYAAANLTLSASRRRTRTRLLSKMLLKTVENQLRKHAGPNLERVVFLAPAMSTVGTGKATSRPEYLMLDDGRKLFVAVTVENDAP